LEFLSFKKVKLESSTALV